MQLIAKLVIRRFVLGWAWSLFLIFALTCGIGCMAPPPVVSLHPISPGLLWVSGRAFMSVEHRDVRVAAAFEHQQRGNLGVRVEIQNLTAAPIEIKPQDVLFQRCDDESLLSCSVLTTVRDPEEMLAQLDAEQSRATAAGVNASVGLTPILLLSAVGDVATVAAGRTDGGAGLQTSAIANQMDNNTAKARQEAASIEGQRNLWANEALRRHTLLPGTATSGFVYIPIDPNAKIVDLVLRVDGRRFHFPFKQTVRVISPYSDTRGVKSSAPGHVPPGVVGP